MNTVIGYFLGLILLLYRLTLKFSIVSDSRNALKKQNKQYILALLHGQQLGAILFADEKVITMASKSKDADLIVPLCRMKGLKVYRGSSNKKGLNKGGKEALKDIIQDINNLKIPALLTIDGPKGPRGKCKPGIVKLSQELQAPVIPVRIEPEKKWVLNKSWDLFEIPKPFSKINVYFDSPIIGYSYNEILEKIEEALNS